MGYYLAFPVLAFAVALQASVLPVFRIYNGQPELVPLLVLSWAINAQWEEAVFWAFVGAILQDVYDKVIPTGTSAITLVLMVFGIQWLARRLYHFNILLLVGFVILGTILHHIVLFIVLSMTAYVPDVVQMVSVFSLPTLGLNLIGVLPIYFALSRIQKRLTHAQSPWGVSL